MAISVEAEDDANPTQLLALAAEPPTSANGSTDQFSNPPAPCTIRHALSLAIFELGTHAKRQQHLNNFPLRFHRRRLTAAATPRILHRQVKCRGARLILHRGIGPGFK